MARVLLILFLGFPGLASAQWVEDLTQHIYSYDPGKGFQLEATSLRPSQIAVDIQKYEKLWLRIQGAPGSRVFEGETLLGELNALGEFQLPLGQMVKPNGRNVTLLTLVPNVTEPTGWHVYVVDPQQNNDRVLTMASQARELETRDALVLIWFVFAFFILLVQYGTPKFFGEYFSASSIFSALQRDEAAMKAPIFERNNLAVMFLYSLALAAIGYVMSFEVPAFGEFYLRFGEESVWWNLILTWFFWAGVLLVSLVFKWVLILWVGYPFNLSAIKKIQFFNYVRLALFIFLPLAVIVLSWYIMFPLHGDFLVRLVQVILLLAFGTRIIMLYLKTRRVSTHRNVHLISYICATEIAPVAVVIKFFYSI